MESLGQKLARFREEADLKQAALAKLIDSTGPTLSKIENDVRVPTAASLSKLLLVFKRYLKWNDDEYRVIYNECFQQLRNSSSSIETTKDGEFNSVSKTIGIYATYKNMDWDYLCLKFLHAKKEIRILTTWMPDSHPIWQGLIDTSKLDVNIQVLALDPHSESTRQRLRDAQYPPGSRAPIASLKNLYALSEKHYFNKIEIRLYKVLPPFIAYIIDDSWCLLGFLWHGISASYGPRIELDLASSVLGEFITKTYKTIWDSASLVDKNTIISASSINYETD